MTSHLIFMTYGRLLIEQPSYVSQSAGRWLKSSSITIEEPTE
jgi:hypothetical protein